MDTIDLRIDGGTQPRERLDEATVARYAEAMSAGLWDFGRLPDAAVAFYDGSDYWLADGFHRLEAAKRAGLLDEFAACLEVRQGTQHDAILHSAGANARHGFARTDDDKLRAVSRLLGDSEWSQWSDREIARRCRVDHRYVGRLRPKLTGDVPSDRTYKTKHGTTATMDTSRIGRAAPKPAQTAERADPDPEQAARRRRNQTYLTVTQAIRAIVALSDAGDLDELPWLLRGAGNQVSDPHLLMSQAECVVERLQAMIIALKRAAGREDDSGTLH